MHTFILLLASNWDATTHLTEAMERIKLHFPTEIRFSRVYESEAFGATSLSPSYQNAVCTGKTQLSQEKMEQWLKETETNMGRIRGESAHGCVHIDLDLVVWDGSILRPVDAARPYYQICLNDLEQTLG